MEEKCILDPQRDCIGKAEAAKLEGRIKALEEWREDSKDFHAKFYDWQRQQIARDARLDEKLSGMDENIKKSQPLRRHTLLSPENAGTLSWTKLSGRSCGGYRLCSGENRSLRGR